MQVSPFRHPRVNGHLHLSVAFRSLSRLSSALSAKASALRSSSLNLHMHSVAYSGTLLKILCSLLTDFSVFCLLFITKTDCQLFGYLGCLNFY